MPDALDEAIEKARRGAVVDPLDAAIEKARGGASTATLDVEPAAPAEPTDRMRPFNEADALGTETPDEKARGEAAQAIEDERNRPRGYWERQLDYLKAAGSGVVSGIDAAGSGIGQSVKTAGYAAGNILTGRDFDSRQMEDVADTPNQDAYKASTGFGHTDAYAKWKAREVASNPTFAKATEITDPVGEALGATMATALTGEALGLTGATAFGVGAALQNPGHPIRAGLENYAMAQFFGYAGKAMGGASPDAVKRAAGTFASAFAGGVALDAAEHGIQNVDFKKQAGIALGFTMQGARHGAPVDPRRSNVEGGGRADFDPTRRVVSPFVGAEEASVAEKVRRDEAHLDELAAAEAPVEAARPEAPRVASEAVRPAEAVPEAPGAVPEPVDAPKAAEVLPAPNVEEIVATGVDRPTAERIADEMATEAAPRPPAPYKPVTQKALAEAKGKSLSQHVREQGGFDYQREALKGELDMLRSKDSGSTGLVKTKAKGGKTAEEMMVSARESGFDIPADMRPGDFIALVGEDVGSGHIRSAQLSDEGVIADAAFRADAERQAEQHDTGPEVDPTSVKNAQVNRERIARGVGEMAKPIRQTFGEVADMAMDKIAENPQKPYDLVSELQSTHRAIDPVEEAILTIHRVNLKKQRAAADAEGLRAFELGDVDGMEIAKRRSQEVNDDFLRADFASRVGGTETARSLAFRRVEMAHDYSLLAMETRRRVENDYRPLTEEQKAETAKLHKDLADALKDRDAWKARVEEIESRRGVKDFIDKTNAKVKAEDATLFDTPEYGKANKGVTREVYDATREAIRAKLNRLSAGVDPTILADVAKMAAFHVEAGYRSFAAWAKSMKKDYGDKIEPYLREAWNATTAERHDAIVTENVEKVRAKVATGKRIDKMPIEVARLAELFVRGGIRTRNELVDAVHGVLVEADPSVTRREVMDAISGYGKVRELNKDPVKVELRELKGQLQQEAKLADMAAGDAPKPSGIERQAPGDEQRRLIKEVNEAKRRGGYDTTNAESRLKTVEETAKTRLKNQIADLTRQIKSGKKDIPNRTKTEYGDEVKSLKQQRDALKEEYDNAFGRPMLSDASRLNLTIKAVEKSIADLRRRVASGDVFPSKRVDAEVTDPRLKGLIETRAELQQAIEDMRRSVNIKRSPFEIAERSRLVRLNVRAADLERRAADGDFAPKPKRAQAPPTKAVLEAETRVDRAHHAFTEAMFRDRLANRTKLQKAAAIPGELLNFSRALMTSFDLSAIGRQGWFIALAHPKIALGAMPDMLKSIGNPMAGVRAARSEWKASDNPLRALMRGFQAAGEAGVNAQARSETAIRLDHEYIKFKKMGLSLSDHGDVSLGKMEEVYASRWGQKVPIVAGTGRAYTTFLNKLRFDAMKTLYHNLPPGKATNEEGRVLARFINTATGRGSIGEKANALGAIGKLFFAPNLVVSRFQLVLGTPMYGKMEAETRKMIAGEYARFLIGMGIVSGLARAAGGDQDLKHATESDWSKIRVGDTRIDMGAGLAQVVTLGARALDSESPNDFSATIGRFVRTKLAPGPALALDLRTGKDIVGHEVTPGAAVGKMFVPMTVRDIQEAMVAQGVPTGAALGLLSIFGMGINTYDKDGKSKGKKPMKPRLR